MKTLTSLLFLLFSHSVFSLEIGQEAPNFRLKGVASKNKEIALSDFKGKIVVLEWLNHGCPFVRKHYDSGNMPSLQKKYTGRNVLWFSIISSAPGKQGYVTAEEAIAEKTKYRSSATDILLDPSGSVGKLYGAKTTPHMYIIDQDGRLAYQGAIDDKADTDQASIPGARNFVALALEEILAKKKVSVANTQAYGCSVKY